MHTKVKLLKHRSYVTCAYKRNKNKRQSQSQAWHTSAGDAATGLGEHWARSADALLSREENCRLVVLAPTGLLEAG